MKTKLFITLIVLMGIQNIFSQDLEGYFEKYYKEGNIIRLQETIDLGLDPNVTKINKIPMVDYVISNSTNEEKVITVLNLLMESGLNLNNPNLLQKIVQNKTRIIIDFLQSKQIKIASITVNNQNSFNTDYLEYLISRGFKINENIIPSRKVEFKNVGFIRNLKAGNIGSVKVGLNTFMSDSKMSHVELYYAIKTKDTTLISEILAKCPDDILTSTYASQWNTTIYGNKPQDFSASHYPLTWAMGTNNLNIVKYLINKGATPLEKVNSKSLSSIQKHVNAEYKSKWHKVFNTNYNNLKSIYEKGPGFSSYHVLRNSLLKEILNKKFVKKVQRSFGLFPDYKVDFFIQLKFLMNNSKIEEIYVKTNDPFNTEFLKEYLVKNKEFFQKLFKKIKHNEINYKFLYGEKI